MAFRYYSLKLTKCSIVKKVELLDNDTNLFKLTLFTVIFYLEIIFKLIENKSNGFFQQKEVLNLIPILNLPILYIYNNKIFWKSSYKKHKLNKIFLVQNQINYQSLIIQLFSEYEIQCVFVYKCPENFFLVNFFFLNNLYIQRYLPLIHFAIISLAILYRMHTIYSYMYIWLNPLFIRLYGQIN